MLSTHLAGQTDAERRRNRYKGIVYGLFVIGILGMALGFATDRVLAGSVVYLVGVWSGMATNAVLRHRSNLTIFDERDQEIARRTSDYTISLAVVVGLGIFPVLFVLNAAGEYTMGPTVAGVLYLFSALGLAWGAIYTVLRVRS